MIDGSKVLCMRNYYRARRGSGGAKTLIYCDQNDDPGSININLMVEHLQALQLGETVCSPSFNFQSRQWSSSQVSPPQSRVLIVEGIYALNHKLRECYDLSIFVVRPQQQHTPKAPTPPLLPDR
jgi:uridine kinase